MKKLPFNTNDAIKIKVLAVEQPLGLFFIGIANAQDVVQICSANERKRDEQDELEKYIGIQRPLSEDRVREIKKFVVTSDASFPNSIILSINPECYFLQGEHIFIKKDKKSANIIDGQHRLSGFSENYSGKFDIIVTLFPELELEEQSYLFSVINTKMTRINPSLAQDLYEFSTIDTPEKLAHDIIKVLNTTTGSPWFGKVKMLGKSEGNPHAILSQSTFSKELVNLICSKKDSYTIRDILKRNKNKRISLKNFKQQTQSRNYIFWSYFIEGEDKIIYDIIKNYFIAVRMHYSSEWENTDLILTKTSGFSGLMKVLKDLIRHMENNDELPTQDNFSAYIKKAKESGAVKEFTSDNYNPGKMGENLIYNNFIEGMKI